MLWTLLDSKGSQMLRKRGCMVCPNFVCLLLKRFDNYHFIAETLLCYILCVKKYFFTHSWWKLLLDVNLKIIKQLHYQIKHFFFKFTWDVNSLCYKWLNKFFCQGHYSIKKGMAFLGLGLDNLVNVKADSKGKMDVQDLEDKILQLQSEVRYDIQTCSVL